MRDKIGSLDCLVRPGENEDQHLVLLHGFGADANDLYPLADVLDPEEQWNVVVPQAPLEVPIGGGFMGRGWFPISVRDLEVGVDFTQVRPPGMDDSAAKVSDLIFHLNSKKLVIGGFSQGAMLTTEIALSQPEDVAGVIIYSGVMLDEKNWRKKAPDFKGKRFLQSHGMQDSVLPFAAGLALQNLLKENGAVGEWIPFGGGHEIPVPVVMKTRAFLQSL